MKKYDVIFYTWNRTHLITRIDATSVEDAKKKVIEREGNDIKITKVKDAVDYICYQYKSVKDKDGTYKFVKDYYESYFDMGCIGFGKALVFTEDKTRAKRFMLEYEVKDEIRMLGRKLCDFKIEKVEVK